jgi:UDP-glucose 4-epimerase
MRPMSARRVLLVGPGSPLRDAVSDALGRRSDLDVVLESNGRGDHRALVDALVGSSIDTVIDTGLIRWGRTLDVDVIGTMRLAAAIADPGAMVRTVVVASSAVAYPASSRAPVLRRESEAFLPAGGTAARIVEAERYVRSLAEAQPHISVSILRLADLAGVSPGGPLTELLHARVVPAVAGFDPMIQLLHIGDAAAAIEHASACALAGTYNVAAQPARWREAARAAHRTVREIPDIGPWTAAFARLFGVAAITAETIDDLRFGRCVDTALIAGTGFHPRRTTADCARTAATHDGRTRSAVEGRTT